MYVKKNKKHMEVLPTATIVVAENVSALQNFMNSLH